MDGWGALTMLIKRQNSDKYRKAKVRYDRQKQKESFLQNMDRNSSPLNFPKVSEEEMKIIKKEIHKKLQKQRLLNVLMYLISFLLIAAFLFLIYVFN